MRIVLDYAVRPTYVVRLSYRIASNSYSMLYWQVAQQGGQWYVVVTPPDLSIPGMKRAIDGKNGGGASDAKKIEELYFRTDPGFLTDVREMLRKNQKVSAIQKCRSKMGLTLVEAKDFVELVQKNS